MAPPFSRLCYQGACALGRGVVTLGFWTLWLVLVLLLAAQIYVASTNELPVPRFVQRALEERLAVSGIHATFGRTIFDPSGRVLIENVRITLPGFEDSVVTARAIYAQLDPWALLADRFEPLDLRVTGVSLRVPALLSPSGRADEIVSDLDAAFLPRGNELAVEYCNCHLGNLAVSVEGALQLGSTSSERRAPLPLAEFLARSYGQLSREGANVLGHLGIFDHPLLEVRLSPSEPSGATARFTLASRECRLDPPTALVASGLQVEGACSLAGAAVAQAELLVTAEKVTLPRFGAVARGVRARLRGGGAPGKAPSGRPALACHEAEVTAATVTAMGLVARGPILELRGSGPNLWSELHPAEFGPIRAGLQLVLWDQPISAQADLDFTRRTAAGRFAGSVGPAVLDAIGARWHKNLLLTLAAPVRIDGEAHFDPGWKFAGVSSWMAAQGVTYKQVTIDAVRGRLEFDGRRLVAPEASARIGVNDARGSYEMEVATQDYRFLLDGHLQPLDITPWIIGTWWPKFFGTFAFPSGPPAASVDLRGCWSNGRKAEVMVFFDSTGIVVRGIPFDRVRTRLFIRPQFEDGLEFAVSRGAGVASGTFTRRIDLDLPPGADSQTLDFDVTSTLDPGPIIRDAGSAIPPSLTSYAFGQPPTLAVSGHYAGPEASGGKHLSLHIDARTPGEFRYQDFPFDGAAARVDVNDDDVTVSRVAAGFAGGSVTGHARISGSGADQRLAFDGALTGANLGRAISVVEAFTARRAHQPPPPLRNYLKEKSDLRLDLSAAAEGSIADPFSYRGGGTATVQGAELGGLRMLGLLSDLLRFTSLRFTSARAGFKIEGNELVFPDISVIGANSRIAASGTYALDRRSLDIRAKIQPFQESKSFPQMFMGAMLTPFSNLLEVKLAGTLDKPTWTLVNGPTNFLRNLGGGGANKPPGSPSLSP